MLRRSRRSRGALLGTLETVPDIRGLLPWRRRPLAALPDPLPGYERFAAGLGLMDLRSHRPISSTEQALTGRPVAISRGIERPFAVAAGDSGMTCPNRRYEDDGEKSDEKYGGS